MENVVTGLIHLKEDKVEGSTISMSIWGESINLLNLFSLTFSKSAQCIVKCPFVPLIHCTLLQLRAIGFFEFRSGAHFPHVTTAISHYYCVKFSIHLILCTLVYQKTDQEPHIKTENVFWSNKKHCDYGNRDMRSHNQ